MIKKQFIAGVLAASLFGFGGGVMTAQAFDFGSVLKLGGISYLVNQFGGEINTFINKIFSQMKSVRTMQQGRAHPQYGDGRLHRCCPGRGAKSPSG